MQRKPARVVGASKEKTRGTQTPPTTRVLRWSPVEQMPTPPCTHTHTQTHANPGGVRRRTVSPQDDRRRRVKGWAGGSTSSRNIISICLCTIYIFPLLRGLFPRPGADSARFFFRGASRAPVGTLSAVSGAHPTAGARATASESRRNWLYFAGYRFRKNWSRRLRVTAAVCGACFTCHPDVFCANRAENRTNTFTHSNMVHILGSQQRGFAGHTTTSSSD